MLMRISRALGWCIAAGVVLCGVISIFAIQPGPLFLIVAVTPWVGLAGVVVTACFILVRWFKPAGLAAAGVALLLVPSVPAFIANTVDRGVENLTVANLNTRMGNADVNSVMAWLDSNAPDMVAFEELTEPAWEALEGAGVRKRYPYVVNAAGPNASGMAFLSRVPIIKSRPIPGTTFTNLQVTLKLGNQNVAVVVIHPAAPGPSNHALFDQDWQLLMPAITDSQSPTIVVGDFNATPRNRQLRDLAAAGFDSAAIQGGAGFNFTWPTASVPGFPVVSLDHVLYRSDQWRTVSFTSTEIAGSDHKGIVATLNLAPAG